MLSTDSQKLDRILEILDTGITVKKPTGVSDPGVPMTMQQAFDATKDDSSLTFEIDTAEKEVVFKRKWVMGISSFTRPLSF